MNAIQDLWATLLAIVIAITLAMLFFRQAKSENKATRSNIIVKAFFVAFIVFVIAITSYENSKEKDSPEGDEWCKEHPGECDAGVSLVPLVTSPR